MKQYVPLFIIYMLLFSCDYNRVPEKYVGSGKVMESTNCQTNKGILKNHYYKTCNSKVEFNGKFYVAKLSSFISRGLEKDIGVNAPVDMCRISSGIIRVCENYKAQM